MARLHTICGQDDVGTIRTPAPALLSVRGQIPKLPCELLSRSLTPADDPLLLQCSVVDWFCLNSNMGLLGVDVVPEMGGLAAFASLPRCRTLLSVRTAGSAEFLTNTPGRAMAISTDSPAYRPVVTPAQVVALQRALSVDLFESPSDSPFLFAPSKRSIPRSVQRAGALLDETLLALGDRGTRSGGDGGMLIPVQGGVDAEQRRLSAEFAAGKFLGNSKAVRGFTLAGFFAGESPAERVKALQTVVSALPQEPLRVLPGHGGAPCDVLDAVAEGVDIVESSYPFRVAADGYALDLRAGKKLNLRDRKYELDWSPLLPGCMCIACKKGVDTGGCYSRSYIRHLLEVHEMMGETLLVAHNLRNYLDWFADLRAALARNEFDMFREDFYKVREDRRTGAHKI